MSPEVVALVALICLFQAATATALWMDRGIGRLARKGEAPRARGRVLRGARSERSGAGGAFGSSEKLDGAAAGSAALEKKGASA